MTPLSLEPLCHALLDQLTASICVLDSTGEIRFTNRPWTEFNLANGGTLQKSGTMVNYLDVCDRAAAAGDAGYKDAAQVAAGIRRLLSGEAEQFDLEYLCSAPHERRRFMFHAGLVRSGETTCVVISHENVTARSVLEDRLRELNRRVVESATKAEVGDFARKMVHDIKNPLAAIVTRAGLMKRLLSRGGDLLQVAESCDEVTNSTFRTLRRLDAFQAMLDEGVERPERIKVKDLVTEAILLVKGKFEADRIFLDANQLDEGVVIEARHMQVLQVLLNLLDSAYEAIEKAPNRWISVAATVAGERARIELRETAEGSRERKVGQTTAGLIRRNGGEFEEKWDERTYRVAVTFALAGSAASARPRWIA